MLCGASRSLHVLHAVPAFVRSDKGDFIEGEVSEVIGNDALTDPEAFGSGDPDHVTGILGRTDV